jgi:long-chain acyl-CoA synthetase
MEARKMSTALKSLGLNKGDHIGIYSKNCYHWILADLAMMIGGFVSLPFFASLPKAQLNEVIIKGDLKALFIGKLDKWDDRYEAVPQNVKIIRFPHYEGNAIVDHGVLWDDLIRENKPDNENRVPSTEDLWTILFTSGTTGSPKGVMHTYYSPAIVLEQEEKYGSLGVDKLSELRYFSFLPLNHVGERIGVEMNCLKMGGSLSFGESIDTFIKNLQETQPTFFFAVPRIWTKFQLGVFSKVSENKLNFLLRIPVIGSIVKKRLRTALGLSCAEITLTGAALTYTNIKKWYRELDIHLREVYGMTEACGGITLTPIGDFSVGNVGKPVPGTEIKIDPTTEEIIFRSPQMMKGYYNDPVSTGEVLRDGWMHSGDRGKLDENGYLYVLGRVKDVFKTSKGIYVVPNQIEESVMLHSYVEQVCVVGLGIAQPIALVNLSETTKSISANEITSVLKEHLFQINQTLVQHEKVSAIVICKENWSEQNQLLTPTLKARRNKIDEQYGPYYYKWYERKDPIIWE